MTKSKAIKSFLKALSHQVPNESLDPLLKPQNDALFVLLNSSIEALPMGSAIRKEVDSNMEDCIDVFRKELEMRKQEMEKKTNAHDEDVENVPFSTYEKIPLINSKLFHLAYNQSNGKDMERFLCSDYATGEIILNHILSKGKKKTASVRDVNVAIQHAFSAGQLSSLDEYIQLFVENLESSNGSRSDVVAEIKSFLKLILLSKDALGVPMDTIKAIDLGKIVGELVTIAVTNTEEYNIALIKANRYDDDDDDDDDDSSDDETLKVLPKKHLPKTEYITMKEECVRDALLVLSMIYSFTNSMDAFKIASAYLTTGLIGVLQDINGKDDHALKDATEILIKALDRSNVMDKHELPSAKLIQDATKRIQLLSKWAERVLKTASLQSQAASEEDAPNSNPIFVMDTFANDVSVESDSDNDADDGSNESESAHASDTDSNEDKESMFILDTEKSDIGIEVTKNDDDENEEDDDSDNEDNDDNDDEEEEEDNENDNDENDDNNDRNEAESDRNEIKETKSKKPSLKKQSKAVLEAVPEDEEVDPTPSKTTTGKTIHATPKRRTRSNSNMSNLSADTPTRMTRSRARGMSTSSIDTFGQESIASSSSKTTPRSTRKRSVSGASDTPVATRRSSRRLK